MRVYNDEQFSPFLHPDANPGRHHDWPRKTFRAEREAVFWRRAMPQSTMAQHFGAEAEPVAMALDSDVRKAFIHYLAFSLSVAFGHIV